MKSTVAALFLAIGIVACAHIAGSSALPHGFAPSEIHHNTSNFKTLVEFNGINGCTPYAGLVARRTTLYGTTTCGGYFGEGEIYSVSATGKFSIVHNFVRDGVYAYAPVAVVGRTLYGTAVGGGKYQGGTVYSVDISGKEHWLYSFRHNVFPYAGLVNLNGTLYGTTVGGGVGTNCLSSPGCGTVFAITSSGREKTIYSFKGGSDGAHPWSGMVALNGTLYGTTSEGGGSNDNGTVFSVTPSGRERVLHAFAQIPDGGNPFGTLIAANGVLYGTTEFGGTSNWGTVYSITTSGQEQIVYSFGSNSPGDALEPEAGLLYLNGKLYGTSYDGGGYGCAGVGCGTIFEVSTSGQEQVLYKFQGGADGSGPQSQLTAIGGVLYGTTTTGGLYYNFGTVFELKP